MPTQSKDFVRIANDAVERIKPILAGIRPDVQGAVLGELFAIYLAGHVGPGRDELRDEIIEHWLELVRTMVPLYQEQLEIWKKNRKKN